MFFFCLGDKRSYSYVVGLSSDTEPNWQDMIFLAKLIPRILHNVNRVCYIFGGHVNYQVNDITHTLLSSYTLSQIRQADHLANEVIFFIIFILFVKSFIGVKHTKIFLFF